MRVLDTFFPVKLDFNDLVGDNIYTLPEDPKKLNKKRIILKSSVNIMAQRSFKHEVYMFVIDNKHLRFKQNTRMKLYCNGTEIHPASPVIKYSKLRELFDLVPDMDIDSESMIEKVRKRIK
jgi:hypothetical protein